VTDILSSLPAIGMGALGLASVAILCISTVVVRRDHPNHVHTLWYIFSLTLCSVSALFAYIYANARSISTTWLGGTLGTLATMFMNMSMDVRGEMYVLAVVTALLIFPQIMSYLVSGIFGCGSPPILVSKASTFMTWSLIKFFCVLAGILAAQSIAALYARPLLNPKDALPKLVEATVAIALSFSIIVLYYRLERLHAFLIRRLRSRWFDAFCRFMTRHKAIEAD
jgi:hypothetical protein